MQVSHSTMVVSILKCMVCGSYGLSKDCVCGGSRVSPKPPKYSPEDKYASYRRQYKELHPEDARRKELLPESVREKKDPKE